MQPNDAVDGVQFGGLDQLGMNDGKRHPPIRLFNIRASQGKDL
jgi:hypothetical protein